MSIRVPIFFIKCLKIWDKIMFFQNFDKFERYADWLQRYLNIIKCMDSTEFVWSLGCRKLTKKEILLGHVNLKRWVHLYPLFFYSAFVFCKKRVFFNFYHPSMVLLMGLKPYLSSFTFNLWTNGCIICLYSTFIREHAKI